MSIMMYMLRQMKQTSSRYVQINEIVQKSSLSSEKPLTPRMEEFKKKLRDAAPMYKIKESDLKNPHQEEEPLESWPNNVNPHTGEIGGPKGPEPTRYGDWERKGRVVDF